MTQVVRDFPLRRTDGPPCLSITQELHFLFCQVILHARNTVEDRLSNSVISVGQDADMTNPTPCGSTGTVSNSPVEIVCSSIAEGRYLRMTRTGEYLDIHEIIINVMSEGITMLFVGQKKGTIISKILKLLVSETV